MSDLAARLALLPEAERRAALEGLSSADLEAMLFHWPLWARPNQLPPPEFVSGEKRVWLIRAGRGFGKNRTASETIRAEVEAGRRMSIALVSPTAETARRDLVKDIIAASPPWCLPVHEPSQRRLVWPNGCIGHCISAEEPDRARGLNLDFCWGDELSSWANAEDTWANVNRALRVTGPKGHPPQAILTTTPKRGALLRAIMGDPQTSVTTGSTFDNAANLDAAALAALEARYAGTTLGRQELMGELLEDAEGALWTRDALDACRVHVLPEMKRTVVAVDPAGGASRTSDETGIVACGVGVDGRAYVLADASGRYTPDGWARAAVGMYRSLQADRIVAEQNYGGAMVAATIRAVDPYAPVKMVVATRGKAVRAEPVSALYEQRRISHVGSLPGLEDQMCGWNPMESGPSPDRVDALVWAITELMVVEQTQPARWTHIGHFGR